MGTFDGQAPSANGLVIASSVLYAQSASVTVPGMVNNTIQSFSGDKTFTGSIAASNFSGASSGTNTGDVTIGTANGLSIVGQVLSLQLSSATQTGALSSADWSMFNAKQAAGNYITDLTGDATATGPGSAVLTFSTVNANVGSFGTATAVGTFTVNAKGLITAASNTPIQITESQVTNLVTDLAAKLTNPMTTLGDIIYEDATPAPARLPGNTTATKNFLTQTGTGTISAAPVWGVIAAGDVPTLNQNTTGTASNVTGVVAIANGGTGATTAAGARAAFGVTPTVVKLTSGSGTYTTPTSPAPLYIRVRMVGGGGSGGGGGAGGAAGTAGGNSTFGTSLLVASGGGAGTFAEGEAVAGGGATISSPANGIAIQGGGGGGAGSADGSRAASGYGGVTPFGGAGPGTSVTKAGMNAVANTGSGGGGGGSSLTIGGGGGGGASGYVDAIITPSASYAYSVGAAGTPGGAAGTGGGAGGVGGSGFILVEEFYL